MLNWYKKEKPFAGFAGFGGGATGLGLGGPEAFSATGGNVNALQPGNGYVYHTFTAPGTLTVTGSRDGAQWFLVAPGGGGAGGNGSSGGGGGGGIVHATNYTLSKGTYTITLPDGGAGGPGINNMGTPGGDATVVHPTLTLTAKGGGGGDGWSTSGVTNGGSGGGAGNPGTSNGTGLQPSVTHTKPGSTIVNQYGNPGGTSNTNSPYRGGGGGGARYPGTNAGPSKGGDGEVFSDFYGSLIGVPSINPLSGAFGGGGGGGTESPFGSGGAGGSGGGGQASSSPSYKGDPGYAYAGGGGGAGTYPEGPGGGDGAKGIVVVRYPTSETRTTYRYWRLYKTDAAQGGGYHREIQWTEEGAGSYYQGTNYQNWSHSGLVVFNASLVTDGNTAINCFHTDSSAVGSWCKLDLGAGNAKYFNKVQIWTSESGTYAVWEIQASNDNTNWVSFHSGMNVAGTTNITRYW